MRYGSLFLAAVTIGLASTQAKADPITYIFNGTVSGFLTDKNKVATPLVQDPFTLTLTGDTNGITVDLAEGILVSSSAVAKVTLGGFGTGTTTDPINVATGIGFPLVGPVDFTQPDDPGVALYAPGLGPNYGLNTSIGPVAAFYATSSPEPLPTSLGGITFLGFQGTFTAVPEPGSVALFVSMGVAGAGFLIRRRRK